MLWWRWRWKRCGRTTTRIRRKIEGAIQQQEEEQDVKTVNRVRVSHCSAKHLSDFEVDEKKWKTTCGNEWASEQANERMMEQSMEWKSPQFTLIR